MSVFLDAIGVIHEKGWVQRPEPRTYTGGVCLRMALSLALRARDENWSDAYEETLAGVLIHMGAVVTRSPRGVGVRVSGWNDSPQTTEELVVLALKEAHEAWVAREGVAA